MPSGLAEGDPEEIGHHVPIQGYQDTELDDTAYSGPSFKAPVPHSLIVTSGIHLMESIWTGHCFHNTRETTGLIFIIIHAIADDGHFQGQGEDGVDTFVVRGSLLLSESFSEVAFTKFYDHDEVSIYCRGKLDQEAGTIRGDWGFNQESVAGSLALGRSPVHLYRFRYTPEEFASQAARARWKFACATVSREVRRSRWSWNYFEDKFAERKRFVELYMRRKFSGLSYSLYPGLSGEEALELQTLEMNLSPADRRFYTSLAKAQARRLCIHLYVAHPYNLSVAFS